MEYQHTSSNQNVRVVRPQRCPMCLSEMGDMPGTRDAYCGNCGYKAPCCE